MNGERTMTKLLACAALIVSLLPITAAVAAERTVTLAVKNMYCAACPHTVKASLEAVPGVTRALVSYKDKTALVTYDDDRVDGALTAATGNAGYPSAPKI
jgi:mercuric ion binding protein